MFLELTGDAPEDENAENPQDTQADADEAPGTQTNDGAAEAAGTDEEAAAPADAEAPEPDTQVCTQDAQQTPNTARQPQNGEEERK